MNYLKANYCFQTVRKYQQEHGDVHAIAQYIAQLMWAAEILVHPTTGYCERGMISYSKQPQSAVAEKRTHN
jgi:hypothetical protein